MWLQKLWQLASSQAARERDRIQIPSEPPNMTVMEVTGHHLGHILLFRSSHGSGPHSGEVDYAKVVDQEERDM
jgi:hypothetical protein